MFGVGTILGHVVKGSSVAGAVKMSPQVAKIMGGAVGKLPAGFGKPPSTGGGPTGGLAGGMGLKLDPSATQKALYMAVLTAALDKAHESRFFNLETQINDLNVKLGNLRGSQGETASLHEAIAAHPLGSAELQKLLHAMGSVTKQALQHMK